MNNLFKLFLACLILLTPVFVFAQTAKLDIYFFYSKSCHHCLAEDKFLLKIEDNYSGVKINRYLISDPEGLNILNSLVKKHDAQRYIGLVPLTFIGDDFFIGFDSEQKMGKAMEESIKNQISEIPPLPDQNDKKIKIPILGNIDLKKYSLPTISVMLGFLDGFNVCSLGALVLILALVLALRSRVKIIIFGGVFLVTSALIYGLLIFLWHRLFMILSPYLKIMELLIGIFAIAGSFYFLRQFFKFKKSGVNCDIKSGEGVASKLTARMQNALKSPRNILFLALSVLLFAAAITIIEFPCSAVIPVIYSGILSQSDLSTSNVIFYLSIYVLFYLFDEILVFLIAISTMRLWIASPKFIKWVTLIESLVLFSLGFYYLISIAKS